MYRGDSNLQRFDGPSTQIRRSGSQERLGELQQSAARLSWLRENDPTRLDTTPSGTPEQPVLPGYGDQPFPTLGPIDRIRKKQVKLLEGHIIDTKNFILTQPNNARNFDKLYQKAGVIKYWIKQHKNGFRALNISENEYNKMEVTLNNAKEEVSTIISNEMYAPSDYRSMSTSNYQNRLTTAIDNYKDALKGVLEVAHNLHRAVNGLPPLAPESSLPEPQTLSPEAINPGVEGLARMRERLQQ